MDGFGKSVKLGEQIFTHTQTFAGKYVGNTLNCASCHLDAGRKADSSPLWGAYPLYPAYRSKNGHVNSFAERLQGCFMYSMNGQAPPLGDPVLVALESYAYWLAKGAPIGESCRTRLSQASRTRAKSGLRERERCLCTALCAMP